MLSALIQQASPEKVGALWVLMIGVVAALATMIVGFLAWSLAKSRRRSAALKQKRRGTHLDVDPWEESARRMKLPPEETSYRRHEPDEEEPPHDKPLDDRLEEPPGRQ